MLTFQKLLPTSALALALGALALSLNPFAANAAASSTPSQKAPYYNTINSASMVAGKTNASPADNQGEPQYSANSKGRPGENQLAVNSKGRPSENTPVQTA